MPGSLFSPPSSPEPEPSHQLNSDERHVRFVSRMSNSSYTYRGDEPKAGSRVLDEVPSPGGKRLPVLVPESPLRPRTIPSVKAAVQRFTADEAEADSSLLLPNSQGPAAASYTMTTDDAGGNKFAPHQHGVKESISGYNKSDKAKGKQRERDAYSDLSRADSSGEMTVRGKERELLAAREEHIRNEKRWERDKHIADADAERLRDKERIRILEQEIAQLKEEVLPDFDLYV